MTGAENPPPSNFRRLVIGCIEAALAEIYTMHSFAQLCNLNFLTDSFDMHYEKSAILRLLLYQLCWWFTASFSDHLFFRINSSAANLDVVQHRQTVRLVREPLQIKSSSCFVFWIQKVGFLLHLLCDFFFSP